MKAEEIAKRRSWATTRFNDKDLMEAELECAVYIPSDNFSYGWDKGAISTWEETLTGENIAVRSVAAASFSFADALIEAADQVSEDGKDSD